MVADDTELMRRIQAGDEEAFELFVTRYQKRLYRLAYASLGNRDEALDATQETFVKIYRARLRWAPGAKPGSWAYRILINHCIDQARRRKFRERFSLDGRAGAAVEPVAEAADSPLAQSLRQEERERVAAAVRRLPEKQRLMLLLRHRDGLSIEEIAEAMACSIGTVKSTLHRAVAKLRVLMDVPVAAASPARTE